MSFTKLFIVNWTILVARQPAPPNFCAGSNLPPRRAKLPFRSVRCSQQGLSTTGAGFDSHCKSTMMHVQSQTREMAAVIKDKKSRRFNWPLFSHDFLLLLVAAAFPVLAKAQNTDLFNYDNTRVWEEGADYGPRDWDQVECDDIEDCVSTPPHLPDAIRLRPARTR